MEHTSNYNLSQWAGEDRILREDFNADNAKIEAALAAASAPSYAVGLLSDYDGSKDVTVSLGKQPQMVVVGNRLGFTNIITTSSATSFCAHAVALPGYPCYESGSCASEGSKIILEITSSGFTLYSGFYKDLAPFYYIAFL